MVTNYPGSLDAYSRPSASTPMNASGYEGHTVVDNLYDAVEAIETELGTDPAGAQATVKARIQLGLRGTVTSNAVAWPSAGYLSNNAFAGTSSGSQGLPSSDCTYLIPFFVPESVTVDRVAVYVATAQTSAHCRLGRYALGTDGLPTGSVVNDWGEIDASSTGYKELTISTALTEGWHCMAVLNELASVALRSAASARVVMQGGSGAAGTIGWNQSSTYGSGFASVGSLVAWTGVGMPLFYLRRT